MVNLPYELHFKTWLLGSAVQAIIGALGQYIFRSHIIKKVDDLFLLIKTIGAIHYIQGYEVYIVLVP